MSDYPKPAVSIPSLPTDEVLTVANTRDFRTYRVYEVKPTVHVSRGDYLACWHHEIGKADLEVAPFGHPFASRLAPLIALEDGDPGQTIKAIEAR